MLTHHYDGFYAIIEMQILNTTKGVYGYDLRAFFTLLTIHRRSKMRQESNTVPGRFCFEVNLKPELEE